MKYTVILKEGTDYESFYKDMESITPDHPTVPERIPEIVSLLEHFDRLTQYELTKEEAEKLRLDDRVQAVCEPLSSFPNVGVSNYSIQTEPYGFKRGNFAGGNWGLLRCSKTTNIFGNIQSDTYDVTSNLPYNYHLDGSGIDIVILDRGAIEKNISDLTDSAGNTRVFYINPLDDDHTHKHATMCALTAAGKLSGWAKNAKIYSSSFDRDGNGNSIDDIVQCMNQIAQFHNNKKVNGVPSRPTIVNMSFGFFYIPQPGVNYVTDLHSGVYRGSYWSNTTDVALKLANYGLSNYDTTIDLGWPDPNAYLEVPLRCQTWDTALEGLINAGIIVINAAGNNGIKIDKLVGPGPDYNNYVYSSSDAWNNYGQDPALCYNRGSSPYSPNNGITVGATDVYTTASGTDKAVNWSAKGPGVTLYAPGTSIVLRYNTSDWTTFNGTSAAAPQVAGMVALYLQANPKAKQAEVKNWLIKNSKPTLYSTGFDNDYTDRNSILGGENRHAYMPFSTDMSYKIQCTILQMIMIED